MEGEKVVRRARECFRKHFQDHKVTGRKNGRGLAVLVSGKHGDPPAGSGGSAAGACPCASLTQKENVFFLCVWGGIM